MRAPTIAGVVAGILVVIAVLVAAVLLLPQASTPAPPTASPVVVTSAAPSRATASGAPASGTPGAGGPSGSVAIGLRVGQQAPPLVVTALDGSTIDLSKLRGRPVWVNFMASWCPSCQDELPLMEKYHAELGNRVAIVLVDVRESRATAAAFAKQMKLDLPVGLDQDGAVQRAWSAYALPIHYWLDENGIVRSFAYGGLGPPQMIESLQRVLPGASIAP